LAPLQALIETLSGELKVARVVSDALRDQLAAAQAETAELRAKSAANEAALEREVIDRRALQQQADHIRRERRAARERVAEFQANIREEQARLRTTEDLVMRLKRELNEAPASQGTPRPVAVAIWSAVSLRARRATADILSVANW
jgi:chromosome segregation ATPase